MSPAEISIRDYEYELPSEKIALFPLKKRDDSKLLRYTNGSISASSFHQLPNFIPTGSTLIFNNSKVINARISFHKTTGSPIEIFCLEPAGLIQEYTTAMAVRGETSWKCFVGGASKWKSGFLEKRIRLHATDILLKVEKLEQDADAYIIRFSWTPEHSSFAEILQAAGDTPLPPYIKRETTLEDTNRYQTIYARDEGSVAAPTAGLHFSEDIFDRLQQKGIHKHYVTLHVGAGTFKPVKAERIKDHEMHAEYIDVTVETIRCLIEEKNTVAVGTTSLRVLESLYWMGVKSILSPDADQLSLSQWEVYEDRLASRDVKPKDALTALLTWMEKKNLDRLFTKTQIIITPGYLFRVAHMLITNFHQPQSTLLLLVAAAIGDDWKKMYSFALENDFRFLSYGDANLIEIKNRFI